MKIRPVRVELFHADSRRIFVKYLYIKFNENPSSESRVVPCGQTDGQI